MAEISEGFCVAACMFTPEKLAKEIKAAKDPKKGLESLKAFMKEVEKVAKTKDKIKYGSEESVFKNSYDPENAVSLSNFAQGISGAVAIHDWLQRHHNESITPSKWTGYLTGAKWPHEVEHLRVHDYGMKDYNSADFLIYTGKQSGYDYYYGISLKKKGVSVGGAKVADPTLINKPISGDKSMLLSILGAKGIKNIETAKTQFFDTALSDYKFTANLDKKLIKKGISKLSNNERVNLIRTIDNDWMNDRLRGKGPTKNKFWKELWKKKLVELMRKPENKAHQLKVLNEFGKDNIRDFYDEYDISMNKTLH